MKKTNYARYWWVPFAIAFVCGFIMISTSCSVGVEKNKIVKVVDTVTFNGWDKYATIYCTDGTKMYRPPGWVTDLRLSKGDTIPHLLLTPADYPVRITLRPVRREGIIFKDAPDISGLKVIYEDSLGIMMEIMRFKTEEGFQRHQTIQMCRGEGFGYYICD